MANPPNQIHAKVDPVQGIRDQRVLPSDLLAMAQQNNPELGVEIGYFEGSAHLGLRVTTGRGVIDYQRGPRQSWYDVFRNAGLLERRAGGGSG